MGSRDGFKPGDRIVTTTKYARIVGNKMPISGVVRKAVSWRSGVWSVSMDGLGRPQEMHESMMEKADG